MRLRQFIRSIRLMKLRGLIVVLVMVCSGVIAMAQAKYMGTIPKDVNKMDESGKRHGMWLVSQPEHMGEEGFTEFGNYDHGLKYGKWYKIDGEGDLVSVEMFKNDVLDGEVKYYDKGMLTCIGHYRGLNPETKYDTIVVVHPVTGEESLKAVQSDRGTTRHGLWQFFDPQTGKLLKEEEYQVDDLVYSHRFNLTKADSIASENQAKKLPHATGKQYKPPAGKEVNYTGN